MDRSAIDAELAVAPAAAGPAPALEGEWLSLEHLCHDAELRAGMLVRSHSLQQVFVAVSRFAPHKSTVLIEGESGSGKELVARALHTLGSRPEGPFVTFNCSNLVESLAESQLFGHVKGAFTDAREDAPGYFRSAAGGTLFLDEVGELPLKLQPKLLRAVESHEVQPVGSTRAYPVDIRLVAATNRDLRAMVRTGGFRDDLYYRLNAGAIRVPPLRERREAIPALIGHFIARCNRSFGKEVRYVSRAALAALSACAWPGNVRQLAHAVESALLLCDGDRLAFSDLPEGVFEGKTPLEAAAPAQSEAGRTAPDAPAPDGGAGQGRSEFLLEAALRGASKAALVRALQAARGNCRRAADLLGVSRYTVYRMLARHGLSEAQGYRLWRHHLNG